MERDKCIDMLKLGGIILMIVGHSDFGFWINKVIYSFHMPFFFLISGYLYHHKNISKVVKINIRNLLLPYLMTILIIWLGKMYKGNWGYGIGIFLATGSQPVFGIENCNVGPLWYLMSYFFALIILHYAMKIGNNIKILFVLIFLFELSLIYNYYWGLLPLGILPGISGALFMFVGYNIQVFGAIDKKILLLIGAIIWIICVFYGSLSMASHIYRLNILQVGGALFGSYFFYFLIKTYCPTSIINKLSVLGANSLFFLCVHSIDFNLGISGKAANFLPALYLHSTIQCIFSIMIVIVAYYMGRRVKIIKQIYNVK